jgi:alpha,alpha-trehalase
MSILSEPATTVAERRASGFQPIAAYGLLADCTSAALVDRDGSIDWLCMPHYDSPAVFARILDPNAGHWSIAPAGPSTSERRYLPGTLVIETTFTTATGSVRLIDAMAFAPGQRGHDLGRNAPHEVLRLVEGVSGSVELQMELAPRPEYGLVRPLFRMEDDGGRTFGGPTRSPSPPASRPSWRTRRCTRPSRWARASGSASPCTGPRP